ncbi:MAG: hypothetical protein LQ341_002960 [Variospora aurantia]|nr:MAG: hypothetical protein LQ341_002960 [Variospora aurantia]
MSQQPNETSPASSTPAFTVDRFTQLLQQFLSDGHEGFQPQVEPVSQATQQRPSASYPALGDTWDDQLQPSQSHANHRAPLHDQTGTLPLNFDNAYSDSFQHDATGLSYNNRLGTMEAPIAIGSPTEQSTVGAVEATNEKPGTASMKPGGKRSSNRAFEADEDEKRPRKKVRTLKAGDAEKRPRKSKTEIINGQLHVEYRSRMVKAVYHSELREEMLKKAPPDLYLHAPDRGRSDLDQTSFWPSHRTWRFDQREGRPEILFQFLPAYDTVTALPGPMKHPDGRIIIDNKDTIVRNWPIPACLSSEVEGGRMEAMSRENGNLISKRDFLARMPPQILKADGEWKEPVSDTAIGMRKNRYRARTGLLAFHPREGSLEKKKSIVQCIPKDFMAQILTSNSLRCWRDSNDTEVAYVSKASEGKHLAKAGSKRLPDDVRADRMVGKNMKILSFKPPNPDAWPYVKGIEDDDAAIALASKSLGLSRVAQGGKKRQRDESPEQGELNTEACRPQNKRPRSAGIEGAEISRASRVRTKVNRATLPSTNVEPFTVLNSASDPMQHSSGPNEYPLAAGAASCDPVPASDIISRMNTVPDAPPSQPNLGQAQDRTAEESTLVEDTQAATRKTSTDALFSPEPTAHPELDEANTYENQTGGVPTMGEESILGDYPEGIGYEDVTVAEIEEWDPPPWDGRD